MRIEFDSIDWTNTDQEPDWEYGPPEGAEIAFFDYLKTAKVGTARVMALQDFFDGMQLTQSLASGELSPEAEYDFRREKTQLRRVISNRCAEMQGYAQEREAVRLFAYQMQHQYAVEHEETVDQTFRNLSGKRVVNRVDDFLKNVVYQTGQVGRIVKEAISFRVGSINDRFDS